MTEANVGVALECPDQAWHMLLVAPAKLCPVQCIFCQALYYKPAFPLLFELFLSLCIVENTVNVVPESEEICNLQYLQFPGFHSHRETPRYEAIAPQTPCIESPSYGGRLHLGSWWKTQIVWHGYHTQWPKSLLVQAYFLSVERKLLFGISSL